MYQFTEDCRIGIPEIDEEHKKLFQMVNEAFALLAEPSATVVGVKNLVLTHFFPEMNLHQLQREAEQNFDGKIHMSASGKTYILQP